jgi:hypothetical protein
MGIATFEISATFAQKVAVSMVGLWYNNAVRRAQIYGIPSYMTNKDSTLVQVLAAFRSVSKFALSLRYASEAFKMPVVRFLMRAFFFFLPHTAIGCFAVVVWSFSFAILSL